MLVINRFPFEKERRDGLEGTGNLSEGFLLIKGKRLMQPQFYSRAISLLRRIEVKLSTAKCRFSSFTHLKSPDISLVL